MEETSQNFKISKAGALQQLSQSSYDFVHLFAKGTMQIELYKPNKIDKQRPHSRDEIYVIVSGRAMFYNEGAVVEVTACDCLHVPAYAEHRFFNFSDDFVTWVFFYGPEGGEE